MAKIGDMDFATLRESLPQLEPEDYAVITNVRLEDGAVRFHLAIHRASGDTVICPGCGKPFRRKQPTAVTCSDACRKRVSRGSRLAPVVNGGIEPGFGTALTIEDAIRDAEGS